MRSGKEIDGDKTLYSSTLDDDVFSDDDLEEVNTFFQQTNTKCLQLKW